MSDQPSTPASSRLTGFGKLVGLGLFVLILWLPAPEGMKPAAWRLAAVTLLMAVFWLTQAMPIAATSLIPLAAFPLLGIQTAAVVSKSYINKSIFLFLGGFVIALGIEKWGLHRRIALHVIRLLGTSLRRSVLGFMLATAFLSMWISNTASTLLMLPIALAMITSISELAKGQSGSNADAERTDAILSKFSVVLLLGVAYAASIGGATTLVGTPTNVTFLEIWETHFPDAPRFSVAGWMVIFVPLGVLMLGCTWCLLTWRLPRLPAAAKMNRGFFTQQLRSLGRPRAAEIRMLIVFTTTALLWIFRKGFQFGVDFSLPGWGGRVEQMLVSFGIEADAATEFVDDSTVAMTMALLMFLIPAEKDKTGGTQYLMDWKTAEKLPWGILLLIGGGFAIAGAFKETGLSTWLGHEFAQTVTGWPPWLLVAAVCLMMTFLTEFTSNVATVAAIVPILAGAAISLGIDPRLIMVPATISTSCAFMLPIATPPNAIIFGSGKIRMGQMVRYGIALNLIGVVLITLLTFALMVPQLGISFETMPDWATTQD